MTPSSNPETPAPELPPGYEVAEGAGWRSWYSKDPSGRIVATKGIGLGSNSAEARRNCAERAWAHYGRAAWAAQRAKVEGVATPDGPESLDSQASRSGEQPLSLHGSDRAGSTISEEGAGSGEQSRPSAPATPTAPAGPLPCPWCGCKEIAHCGETKPSNTYMCATCCECDAEGPHVAFVAGPDSEEWAARADEACIKATVEWNRVAEARDGDRAVGLMIEVARKEELIRDLKAQLRPFIESEKEITHHLKTLVEMRARADKERARWHAENGRNARKLERALHRAEQERDALRVAARPAPDVGALRDQAFNEAASLIRDFAAGGSVNTSTVDSCSARAIRHNCATLERLVRALAGAGGSPSEAGR